MTDQKLRAVHRSMLHRCNSPRSTSYPNYGGRGIKVCARWQEPGTGFQNFLDDMGPRPSDKHSIDRIDVDGDYCPENCRWSNAKEQARNRRENKKILYQNKMWVMAELADHLGVTLQLLWQRVVRDRLPESEWDRPPKNKAKSVVYQGKESTISEIASELGIPCNAMYNRVFVMKWPESRWGEPVQAKKRPDAAFLGVDTL